jgi:succinate-semialdehyde dehydrogenase / glutarate-semialdehyde dehydrogenase
MSSYTKLLFNKSFINGDWHDSEEESYFAVNNPTSNLTIIEVAEATKESVDFAIQSAHNAFPAWKQTPARKRAKIMKRWQALIAENVDSLAEILTLEMGKPLIESRGEILYGNTYIEWFAEEAKRINGDVLQSSRNNHKSFTLKSPVGVVAAITPWNFPNAMITRKIAPAIAAGCTVVVKPSEETPLSALALAELANEAGFPPGVINVVVGSDAASIGKQLTESPLVKKISFTGSTAVGKKLLNQSADTVKKVSMELGGNAPFIVFEDADIDDALESLMACKFRNNGQTCISANRIMVHQDVHDDFVTKLNLKMKSLVLGTEQTSQNHLGPLINTKAVKKINSLIDNALTLGADLITGGKVADDIGPLFYHPTMLTNVNENMDIFNQEIFGPVVSIMSFDNEQQAIDIANNTPFGLAAYFFTNDMRRVWRVGEGLEYGIVGVNEGILSNETAPFGGVKESGLGREGSKYGIDEYLELKYLCIGGL